VRREGVRAEGLKDGDDLLQRYRKLQSQSALEAELEAELDRFTGQAEATRTWIADLVRPLASKDGDAQKEERKHQAQVGSGL